MSIDQQIHDICENLVKQAEEVSIPCDHKALHSFAAHLQNMYRYDNSIDAVASLPDVKVPVGFFHVNYTGFRVVQRGKHGELILDDARPVGRIIRAKFTPLTLLDVIGGGQVLSELTDATIMGPARWLSTIALPVRRPGLLELGLILEPYEENDGSFEAQIKVALRLAKEQARRHSSVRASTLTSGQKSKTEA